MVRKTILYCLMMSQLHVAAISSRYVRVVCDVALMGTIDLMERQSLPRPAGDENVPSFERVWHCARLGFEINWLYSL